MQLRFKPTSPSPKSTLAFFAISFVAHIFLIVFIVVLPPSQRQNPPEDLIVAMVELPEPEPEPRLTPPAAPEDVQNLLMGNKASESNTETPAPSLPPSAEPPPAPRLSPNATELTETEGNNPPDLEALEPEAPEPNPEPASVEEAANKEVDPPEAPPEEASIPEATPSEPAAPAETASQPPPQPKPSAPTPPIPTPTPPAPPQVKTKVTPPQQAKPSREKLKKTGLLALLDKKKTRTAKLKSKFGNRLRKPRKLNAIRKNKSFRSLSDRTKRNLDKLKSTAIGSEQRRLLKRKAPKKRSQRSKIEITHGSGRNYGVISEAIEQKKGRLSTVYTALLQSNPELQGNLIVEFTIAPGGRVSKCQILTSSLENPSFEKALIKEIRLWKFPSVTQGETTVLYPLSFFPAS